MAVLSKGFDIEREPDLAAHPAQLLVGAACRNELQAATHGGGDTFARRPSRTAKKLCRDFDGHFLAGFHRPNIPVSRPVLAMAIRLFPSA